LRARIFLMYPPHPRPLHCWHCMPVSLDCFLPRFLICIHYYPRFLLSLSTSLIVFVATSFVYSAYPFFGVDYVFRMRTEVRFLWKTVSIVGPQKQDPPKILNQKKEKVKVKGGRYSKHCTYVPVSIVLSYVLVSIVLLRM
jgi:hypothetical protein